MTKQYNNPKPKEWESKTLSHDKYADWKFPTVSDGLGVRGALFVSGCPFHCVNCFNASIWNFDNGKPYNAEIEDRIIADLSPSYVKGLTLLGGEPFLNTNVTLSLVNRIRKDLPEKDIWSWTGYTWEELMLESDDKKELLSKIDVLVDGRFDQRLVAGKHPFRGSSNQRIIDVQKSLRDKTIHEIEI